MDVKRLEEELEGTLNQRDTDQVCKAVHIMNLIKAYLEEY